ncbi:MAG: DMT family transporter, partial [Bdellovibrionia bacterium]
MAIYFGPIFALFSSFTFAIGSSFYSPLTKKFSPFAIYFSRGLVTLPVYLLVIWITNPSGEAIQEILTSIKLSQIGWLTLSAISSTALGNMFFLWSSTSIGVTRALAISSIFPLWTAALGWMLRGEVLTSTGAIALILLVGGVIVVITTGKKN